MYCVCMRILTRSIGATTVRAVAPAIPPHASCFTTRINCSFFRARSSSAACCFASKSSMRPRSVPITVISSSCERRLLLPSGSGGACVCACASSSCSVETVPCALQTTRVPMSAADKGRRSTHFELLGRLFHVLLRLFHIRDRFFQTAQRKVSARCSSRSSSPLLWSSFGAS